MKTANENKLEKLDIEESIRDLFLYDGLGPDEMHEVFCKIIVEYMNHEEYYGSNNRELKGITLKKIAYFLSNCKRGIK